MKVPEGIKHTFFLKNEEACTLQVYIENNPFQLIEFHGIECKVYQFCFLCGKERFNQSKLPEFKLSYGTDERLCDKCVSEMLCDWQHKGLFVYRLFDRLLTERC